MRKGNDYYALVIYEFSVIVNRMIPYFLDNFENHRLSTRHCAYRMESQASRQAEAADPQNRLLHRMPIRRLEAECIRDAILAVSGRLDPKLYGPPVMPYLSAFTPGRGAPPSGLWTARGGAASI